ncbi:hypothetical protein OUZ56_012601 [Daphnia magna]|uniref:DDE-1 domain-containing protein n=1 Tax=Daphnia magna TaxID=35525 RepID=A0ABQ9Z3H5_9CRUS|nr:hypothetical protein OUZ56_012601 [Daphnia magna]
MSMRKPENTSQARAAALNHVVMVKLYYKVQELYEKHSTADQILNVDETNYPVVLDPDKVYGRKSGERGSNVTMCAFISASELRITIYDVPLISEEPIKKAFTVKNITKTFEATGIFPLDRKSIPEKMCALSKATDLPATTPALHQTGTLQAALPLSQQQQLGTQFSYIVSLDVSPIICSPLIGHQPSSSSSGIPSPCPATAFPQTFERSLAVASTTSTPLDFF